MKAGILALIIVALVTDPILIGKINKVKDEAKNAYLAGDYETAASKYQFLVDSLKVTEDEVLLNLANAYYQMNDTAQAIGNYQSLTQSSKNKIRSTAQQQLGVVANKQGKFEEALNHFKEAIKSDPTNQDARYNYELLKRKLEEQKKQEQQQKDDQNKDQNKDKKDQQNQDQQKQDQQKKDQEKKNEEQKNNQDKPEDKKQENKPQDQQEKEQPKDQKENKPSSEKLEQMKISEEKAKMILEAMKNQEIQYLQQNKRKATQPRDKSKPDW